MGGSTWGSGCQVELNGGKCLADGARKYTAKVSPEKDLQKTQLTRKSINTCRATKKNLGKVER
jgi:hypothetical protein